MKEMGALAAAVLASLSQAVCAQGGDAVDRLKACSQFEGMERLNCVDELLGEIAEPPDSAPTQGPNWIIRCGRRSLRPGPRGSRRSSASSKKR